ncbi:GIY-YIG nuclease family protein [Actinoplanes sp. NPDC026623]|uniref:GIY-YIG nuclease family protein n=1 Tax=Actinoplanes sp. NPDC026623 TaxID=3155610 RepID=UPI0033E72506
MGNGSDAGYIYLVRFTTGVVKGGRTADPMTRLRVHRSNAARFGVAVTHTWVSPELANLQRHERLLMDLLQSLGRRAKGGREYFLDTPFSLAKAQMEHWIRRAQHGAFCGCSFCEADCFQLSVTVAQVSQILGWRGDFLNVTADFELECGGRFQADIADHDVSIGRLVLAPEDRVDLEVARQGRGWTIWAVTEGGRWEPSPVLTVA